MLLTKQQNDSLGNDVAKYLVWLKGRLDANASNKYEFIQFSAPDDGDWFMKVSTQKSKEAVKFNTKALESCSFDFYRMIVLHECFHLLVQDVPNKIDAKRMKDDFGDPFMTLLDVEADYYTYLYLKEFHSFTLEKYISVGFDGGETFGDNHIRTPKFERFLSTLLTIVNHNHKMSPRNKEIFLVTIKNVLTESALHSLIVKDTHFESSSFSISPEQFSSIQKCYERKFSSKKEYSTAILKFCFELLGINKKPAPIPKEQ